jgi:prepilin-type N-terminal cleavage/methylation domain-containing protein
VDTIQPTTSNQKAKRAGFSLLEVLVASGILVVGLASVAALLPAAADRMRQAIVQDRAGALAANAYADIMARRASGLLSASNLNGGQFLVFGSNGISTALTNRLNAVNASGIIDATKLPSMRFATAGSDFDNQDSVEYTPNGGNLPINDIIGTGPGGAFTERGYRQEICWLATLASGTVTPPAGAVATLSIAIFKNQTADCIAFDLSNSSGVYAVTDPSTSLPPSDDDRRAYLSSCSFVLDASATPPRWCQITSSWTTKTSTGQTISTSVILDPQPTGTTVLGFEHLVRVDSHPTRLD